MQYKERELSRSMKYIRHFPVYPILKWPYGFSYFLLGDYNFNCSFSDNKVSFEDLQNLICNFTIGFKDVVPKYCTVLYVNKSLCLLNFICTLYSTFYFINQNPIWKCQFNNQYFFIILFLLRILVMKPTHGALRWLSSNTEPIN